MSFENVIRLYKPFQSLFAACQWVSDLCFEVEEETNFAAFYKLRTMLSH